MINDMQFSTWGNVAGLGLSLCAGAANVMWPEAVWISWTLFSVGAALIAGSTGYLFHSRYQLRLPVQRRHDVPIIDVTPATPVDSGQAKTRTAWLRDTPSQDQLLTELKSKANEHATLKIMIADMKYRPLADKLISVFQLAGWKATLYPKPLEQYLDAYHEGIEVKGYNSHFVEVISDLLKKSGLSAIRTRVEQIPFGPENPKWPTSNHTIKITIGHSE